MKNQLTMNEVMRITGYSADFINKKEKIGCFPKKFRIDKFHTRWNKEEVEEWAKNNPRQFMRERQSNYSGRVAGSNWSFLTSGASTKL
jgi:predicted DNA-binding transcriptional regulator AlpA